MRRQSLDERKLCKNFYRNGFRRAAICLLGSVSLNIFLCMGIFLKIKNMPEAQFYATNGLMPPSPLVALDLPNYSQQPLLPDDSPEESSIKILPTGV